MNRPVSQPRSSRTHLWLGSALSLLSIVVIIWLIEPAEIIASLQTARYSYLLLCALCVLLFLALRAVRWRFLLNGDPPWGQTFHIQNIGYMLTMILPLRLGDVARAALIGNVPPVTLGRGVMTMLVERLLDLLFFVVLLPFTLANLKNLPAPLRNTAIISGLLALGGVALLILMVNQQTRVVGWASALLGRLPFLDSARWLAQIEQLLAGLNSLQRWRDGLRLLLLSILVWLPVIAAYYIVLRSVALPVSLSAAAFVTCVAAFSVAAPSSPGQIGVFHLAVTAALTGPLGLAEAPALTFAILLHTTQFLVFILMGVVGLVGAGTTFGQVVATAHQRTGH